MCLKHRKFWGTFCRCAWRWPELYPATLSTLSTIPWTADQRCHHLPSGLLLDERKDTLAEDSEEEGGRWLASLQGAVTEGTASTDEWMERISSHICTCIRKGDGSEYTARYFINLSTAQPTFNPRRSP